jgi:hypothetical protein
VNFSEDDWEGLESEIQSSQMKSGPNRSRSLLEIMKLTHTIDPSEEPSARKRVSLWCGVRRLKYYNKNADTERLITADEDGIPKTVFTNIKT